MKRFVVLAAAALLSSGCALGFQAEARGSVVPADDGYPLRVYEMVASGAQGSSAPARGSVFYVDGSRRRSVLDRMGALAGFCMLGFSVVLVQPRGLADDGSFDREAARRADTKEMRVSDQRRVVESFLARRSQGSVLLFGASEGGDVAARVAAEDARVTHLILLGSGGGISQADELRLFVKRQPGYLGVGSEAELDTAFERIRGEPAGLREWLGHPYRRWSSYLWSRPADDLARTRAQVLALHGSADTNVPVESARALVAPPNGAAARAQSSAARPGSGPGITRGRLTYLEYPGVDHRFRQRGSGKSVFPCAEIDVIGWLEKTGVLSPNEARTFAERTRGAHPEWFPRGEARCSL